MDEEFFSPQWLGSASEHEAPEHAQHAEFGTAMHSLVFALALLTQTEEFSDVEVDFNLAWNDELTAAVNNHVFDIPYDHLEAYAQGALAILWKKRPKRGATEHETPREEKPIKDIMRSLDVIMRRRRLVEPHDWQPIQDPNVIAGMMNAWRREWLRQELTPEQKQKEEREQNSIFNAYLNRRHGGKQFVSAIWQTGASWMPPLGASEHGLESNTLHVMARFGAWLDAFLNSLREHASNPATRSAHARSGHARGQSGLSAEESAARSWRAEAQSNYKWAVYIAEQLGDRRPQARGWAAAHYRTRAWRDLNWGERWWVQQLRSGALMRELQAARAAHGGRVEAPPFRMVGAPVASTTLRLRSRSPRRNRRAAPAASAAPVASTLPAASSSTSASRMEHYRRRMQTKLDECKAYLKNWKKEYAKIRSKAFQ